MTGTRIRGRLEQVNLDPPVIRFVIERHGATVMGSSRAELQDWTVDVAARTASYTSGQRQVYPMEPRLDVRPIAQEISDLITRRQPDPRLKWQSENKDKVRVSIGALISAGSAVKQTVEGRRKRFRKTLTALLAEHGWVELRANLYEYRGDPDSAQE